MNELDKYFDAAFSAPNGIKKLRRLILSLAMQGKLVPQDPNDIPASELLKKIKIERTQLSKKGKIKSFKPSLPIAVNEFPYSLPQGWVWAHLQDFSDYKGRPNIETSEIQDHTWVLDLEDIEKESSLLLYRATYSERKSKSTKSTFKKGDVLYGKLRPYLDKTLVADSDGVCTTEIVPIVPSSAVTSNFLRWLLKRPSFLSYVDESMYGVKMPRLGTDAALHSIHPLPPVEEQHRIVDKIDELMKKCDELENLQAVKEEKRLVVHAAAIKQLLNIASTDEHQYAQAFLLEHFSELYSVKENVTELRKAILQLAVMGKLVPQDLNDPPASELLKEIKVEKKRLAKESKIKTFKPLPPIETEKMPYPLPQGWEWDRLGNILSFEYGDNLPAGKRSNTGEFLVYGSNGIVGSHNTALVQQPCIIIGRKGSAGALNLSLSNGCCVTDVAYYCIPPRYINLHFCFKQLHTLSLDKLGKGIKPGLNRNEVYKLPIAIPPLPEQLRIVTKTNQLMALCDSLEKQIDIAANKQNELLNALLHTPLQKDAEVIDLISYRAAIGCYIVQKMSSSQYFGRTTAAKMFYLAQAHVGLNLDLQPIREAAGPLDTWIYDFERSGESRSWFHVTEKKIKKDRTKTEYKPMKAMDKLVQKAKNAMTTKEQREFDRLINLLIDKKTEDVEIIATLFAVWNDFLIDGIQPTDSQIIADVRENWHEQKARFSPEKLKKWLNWLRDNQLIPQGQSPRTAQQEQLVF